ncbi:matrixin family metalloprotease [Streptomyces sp. A5-4]|uniref:matrixin family metalloprotease n=1 Tax=Streptomyces sp. A5-4 TaxID=3384771 RepID=UPI003DA8A757
MRVTLVRLACAAAACGSVAAGALGAHAFERPDAAAASAAAAGCVESGKTERRSVSSVDGRELRWGDSTRYNDARAWAHRKWYRHRGLLQRIRIAPDNARSSKDLEWRDWYRGDNTLGTWRHTNGTDHIYFNTRKLSRAPFNTRDTRRAVAVHELGHALGLCHKSRNVRSVMRTTQPRQAPLQAPTFVDKTSYSKLWG